MTEAFRRPGFCKHYSKELDADRGTCAVGLDPYALKDEQAFLPARFMPCIPNAEAKCNRRQESANA